MMAHVLTLKTPAPAPSKENEAYFDQAAIEVAAGGVSVRLQCRDREGNLVASLVFLPGEAANVAAAFIAAAKDVQSRTGMSRAEVVIGGVH